jgi:hypothetical protein
MPVTPMALTINPAIISLFLVIKEGFILIPYSIDFNIC